VAGRARCGLGRSLQLSLSHLVLGMPAASVVEGMRFLSVHQFAVAACRCRCCTALFWSFLVQVAAPTPHTTGRLLAVIPGTAELLTFVTLRDTSLGFVFLHPDCNMAMTREIEYLLGL
jgi:hypothetical protein